jgi:hypothetical protein
MTPLIGAYLADAVIGRFWTIAGASLVYQVVRAHIHNKPMHMKELELNCDDACGRGWRS